MLLFRDAAEAPATPPFQGLLSALGLSGVLNAFNTPADVRATRAAESAGLPLRLKVYALTVPALAASTYFAWQQAWPMSDAGTMPVRESQWTLPMVFAALSALAVIFPLRLTRSYKLTLDGAAFFASLLLFGPVVAMLMAGLGAFVGNVTLLAAAKRDVWNTLFNTGRSMLAVAAAGLVSTGIMTGQITTAVDNDGLWAVLGLVATAATLHVMNTFPTAVAVGLQHRKNPLPIWLKARRADLLQSAALYLVGLLAALTIHDRPWTIIVMVMPLAPIYVTLKRTVEYLERQLDEQTVSAVEAMADAVDMRDHYTFDHSKRVAQYAVQIAQKMGLPAGQTETIRLAARVHDLGKIGVPDNVLRKPGPLTPEEWEVMERHVQIGYDILSRFADYRECKELVLLHHERCDGSGYPHGVAGDQNRRRRFVSAQVIAVADALDAMTSDRPYRSAQSMDYALSEFRRLSGTQWLPEVVDAVERRFAPVTVTAPVVEPEREPVFTAAVARGLMPLMPLAS